MTFSSPRLCLARDSHWPHDLSCPKEYPMNAFAVQLYSSTTSITEKGGRLTIALPAPTFGDDW